MLKKVILRAIPASLKPVGWVVLNNILGSYGQKFIGTGSGINSARSCYSVWLRHLVMSYKNGLSMRPPKCVAELGPGESLGVGLAALLSGANKYYALDAVRHSNITRNIEVFDELVELFINKEDIPDEIEFPRLEPKLETYEFPEYLLTQERLKEALSGSRIEAIRNEIISSNETNGTYISYFVPWSDSSVIKESSVDMIISQVVLEHVDDLKIAYPAMYLWLKPWGFMSHRIDYQSHGTSAKWNGHWGYSDFTWKLIMGRAVYLINRCPHSYHINLIEKAGFKVTSDIKYERNDGINRKNLAPRFRTLSNDDLSNSGCFIQCVKPDKTKYYEESVER